MLVKPYSHLEHVKTQGSAPVGSPKGMRLELQADIQEETATWQMLGA